VAGTLRPSKLEALLGSERVGLDRDGQAQVGAQVRDHTQQQALLPTQAQDPIPAPGEVGKGLTLTWWGWPQNCAGSSDRHKYLTGVVSMGLAARGSPQILPATGPRPLVVRGAQPERSSCGAPLGGSKRVE
jgi:hypothetical protein